MDIDAISVITDNSHRGGFLVELSAKREEGKTAVFFIDISERQLSVKKIEIGFSRVHVAISTATHWRQSN